MKTYKIQNPDGLFSKGGTTDRGRINWSTKGKAWTSIGALRSHVTMITDEWARVHRHSDTPLGSHPYKGCTVVTFVAVEDERRPVDIHRRVDALIADLDKCAERATYPTDYDKKATQLRNWKAQEQKA